MLDSKIKEAFLKIKTEMGQVMHIAHKAEANTKDIAVVLKETNQKAEAAATQKEFYRFIEKTKEKVKQLEQTHTTNKKTDALKESVSEDKKELKNELKKIEQELREQTNREAKSILEDVDHLKKETKHEQKKEKESLSKKIEKVEETSQHDLEKTKEALERKNEKSEEEITQLRNELKQLRENIGAIESVQRVTNKEVEKALKQKNVGIALPKNGTEKTNLLVSLKNASQKATKKKSKKQNTVLNQKWKIVIALGVLLIGVGAFFLVRFLISVIDFELAALTDNIFFFLIPLGIIVVIMIAIAFALSRFSDE